ncbi:hypothetical protein PCANB_003057 [Pneumocystis canis]|nr:hypothetical protein PCANB_003057 [Pneumocystis canis]
MTHQYEKLSRSIMEESEEYDNDIDFVDFVFGLSIRRNISWNEKKIKFLIKKTLITHDTAWVLNYLFKTHQFCLNKSIHLSIQHALLLLYEEDPEQCVMLFILALDERVSNIITKTVSTQSIFILLKWTNSFITNVSTNINLIQKYLSKLVSNQAILLELCLFLSTKNHIKSTILRSVQKTLKNILIKASNENAFLNLNVCIEELTRITGKMISTKNTILLGIIAKIVFHSQSNEENIVIIEKKDKIIDYYVQSILESNVPLSNIVITGLNDFFTYFITYEDFESKLVLHLEKALLRVPEIILDETLKTLVLSLSPTIDISKIVYEKFFIPILNALKSSDTSISKNALQTFEGIIQRCNNHNQIQLMMEKIIFSLNLESFFSLDHKLLYIRSLTCLPKSLELSKSVLSFLIPHIYKKTGENISIALIKCFFSYFSYIISITDEIPDDYIELIKNGFKTKALGIKKIWFIEFGNIIWEYRYNPSKQITYLIRKLLDSLSEIYENILVNPLQSIKDGIIIGGYVCTVIFLNIIYKWKNENIDLSSMKLLLENYLLSSENISHIIFWDKIYTKNLHKDDKIWFIHSLEAITECTPKELFEKIGPLWTQASFSLILSNMTSDHLIVSTTCHLIKCCYLKFQEIVLNIFLSEIWKYIEQLESPEKSENNTTIINAVYYILNAISPNTRDFLSKNIKENSEKQLIKMIVLYHHPLLKNKLNWITLCRKFKIDPYILITTCSLEFVNTINYLLHNYTISKNKLISLAIQSSISTLASLDETIIVPLFVKIFMECLSHSQLENISEEDISIWMDRTNEKLPETNTEINSINFVNKKTISNVKSSLISGLIIIQGLALATQKNRNLWYYHAIDVLLSTELLKKGSLIVDEYIIQTYLSCANCTSLKNINTMIGIAILRIFNVSFLQPNLIEEPLKDLVTRLLSQLIFLVKQRPLDEISFVYILPLLIQVIKRNGVGTNDFNECDKQIMLAVNIISFNLDFCTKFILKIKLIFTDKSSISRIETIQALLNVLYHFPNQFNKAKDCLILLCKTVKNNITKKEIMELIKNSISSIFQIRNVVLQAIEPLDLSQYGFFYELYLTAHDKNETNASMSLKIMEKNSFLVKHVEKNVLINYICNDQSYIRDSAAKAILSYIKEYTQEAEEMILTLIDLYKEKSKPPKLEYDNFGIIIPRSLNKHDSSEIRSSIALALSYLIPYFTPTLIPLFFKFLIGEPEKYFPLNDNSLEVRQRMLKNGLKIISYYKNFHIEEIFKILNNYLESSNKFTENEINEGVIILYGTVTSYLKIGDQRVHVAIGKLMNMLKNPSENIQITVAECLSLLIKFSLEKIPNYIERLKEELFTYEKYAERKGASYGLAGVVKGGNMELLKEYEIIETLKTAITNKKDQNYRQGALFAIESFSQILGQDFEPYIIEMIPYLLVTFGDPVVDVRESTSDAVKVIMEKISEHGMKLILPSLLSKLDDNNWRIKKGSIDFLGSIAYCAPYQLSSSLPIIIPRLTETINDFHLQVRLAGNESLLKFGKTISNPEIQKLVPILLKALSDPNQYTESALDLLLKFSFTHHIDSSTLAIFMPVLEQGLKEHSVTLKKKAIRIIEKISYFVETDDFIPYLDNLLLYLRKILVDPRPATRTISAKALGTLVKNIGEANFPQLVPDLLSTLEKNIGSIDRHGSAEGISEILSNLNIQYLEKVLPRILENSISPVPYIQEGYISLFIYLSQAFGPRFLPYIEKVIPPILLGLENDSESVREVSLSAGKVIINNYSVKAVDLLLPRLQEEIFNENWRIRLSSIQLIGDILFHITGISGKAYIEKENINTLQSYKNILLNILGQERRDSILASLYLIREDSVEQVQFAALNVWKTLVINPSKTIKEILPVIINMIIYSPIASSKVQNTVFIKTLGELAKKMGDDIISYLLLSLQEGLNYAESAAKVRIYMVLAEIIQNSNAQTLKPYKNTLIKTIQYGFMNFKEVRKAASQMFSAVYKFYGNTLIDQILPDLLDTLYLKEYSENTLEALKELIFLCSQNILPILIPKITKVPLSTINIKIINSFAQISDPSFKHYLSTLINSLMDTLISNISKDTELEVKNSINNILLSIYDFEGMNILISTMLKLVKNENKKKQILACQHMTYFFNLTKQDYSRYFEECIRVFFSLFDDDNEELVKSAWEAQNALTLSLKKEDMENLVAPVQKILHNTGTVGRELKAFKLSKGINVVLPIFLQGIMYGSSDKKELAAMGISEIIQRTDSDMLNPFVIQITGPLIRTMGEQYPIQVKLAILNTLELLFDKVPLFLKPFLPQLQRIFLKSLSDSTSDQLRLKAEFLLKKLITLQPKLEPLINELVSGSNTDNNGVKHIMIKSLFNIVSKPDFIVNEMLKNTICTLIEDNMDINDFQILAYIGKLSTVLFKYFNKNTALSFLYSKIFVSEHTNYSILTLNAILAYCSEHLIELNHSEEIVQSIINGCLSNKPYIANNGLLAAGKFFLDNHFNKNPDHIKHIIETFVNCMKSPKITTDASRLILTIISIVYPHFHLIVPIVFHNVHHTLTPIKLAAESAYIFLFKITLYDKTLFNEYIKTLDPTQAKAMVVYHKRIIAKIATIHEFQNNFILHSDDDYNEIKAIGSQKRLAAAVLNCGKRQNIRKLIKDGLIIRKPPIMHSHYRVRQLSAAKRKGRHTGLGKRKGTAEARFSSKVQWQSRLRVLRRLLRRYRDDGKINKYLY